MSDDKGKRRSHLDSASTVLHGLLKNQSTPLSESFLRWRLWNSWESVVGPEIGANSLPVGYANGCLYVWVKSAARIQELTFVVRPLMQKINDFAGKKWVRSIRFTQDRKSVPAPATETAEDLKKILENEKI